MLRIGTRGSKLALWQANFVKNQLLEKFPKLKIEISIIKTSGDINLDDPLSEIGGKGVFVKEIEDALLKNIIDIAVHSLKDVPTLLPDGLCIGSFLKRHDPRDCLISNNNLKLNDLTDNAIIGTGSIRRKYQLLSKFPGFTIKNVRGNVDTRIKKLLSHEYDAIILAAAGIERLNLKEKISEYFDTDFMIPSPCQGIIGIECREHDNEAISFISEINDKNSEIIATLERSFLKKIGGDCTITVGCYAEINNELLSAKSVYINTEDGSLIKKSISGDITSSFLLGKQLAESVLNEIN